MKKIEIRPNRLLELRESRKLTIREVSQLTRIDPARVSRHERMECGVSNEAIAAYAKLYKVQAHELFFDNEGCEE